MYAAALLDILVFTGLIVLSAIFILLEAAALRSRRRMHRILAGAPAMVVAWIVAGILLNPAAHSLWPIEIMLWLIPGIALLLGLRHLSLRSGRANADRLSV